MVRFDVAELPNFAALENGQHACDEGMITVVEGFHQDVAGACGGICHFRGFGCLAAMGFSQRTCLPASTRDAPFGMETVGQRIIDGINFGVGDQGGVGGMTLCNLWRLGKGARF